MLLMVVVENSFPQTILQIVGKYLSSEELIKSVTDKAV